MRARPWPTRCNWSSKAPKSWTSAANPPARALCRWPEAEELRRVMPVIEQLAARVRVPISIDTIKPGVARAALAAGASIVNDVAANRDG